jgi:hypothetical protein
LVTPDGSLQVKGPQTIIFGQHVDKKAPQLQARGIPSAHRQAWPERIARREVQDSLKNDIELCHDKTITATTDDAQPPITMSYQLTT